MMWRSAALGLALSIGCDAPTAPCTGDVAVFVESGVRPRFSWSPDCGVRSLRVIALDDAGEFQESMWYVAAEKGGFGPPVIYGVVPRDATGGTAATLEVSRTYRVEITRFLGGNFVELIGSRTFTWFPPD